MKQNTGFSKLDLKLKIEAITRSGLWGVTTGALIAFAAAVACWFIEAALLWVAIVTFLLASAISGLIFYFTKFRPSVAANAKRIDRCGLDERAITMVELAGDSSYIAKRQREDALEKIANLEPKNIRIRVSLLVILLATVFTLMFSGMTVVEGLSSIGVLPTGKDVWLTIFPPEPLPKYTVNYEAGKGGALTGVTEQTIEHGSTGELVTAVPNDGYIFLYWSDGMETPYRIDENVTKSFRVTAIFTLMDNFDDSGNDEDEPDDAPGGDGDQETNNPDAPPSGGEKYVEVNQIIDGQTFYRDVLPEYYKDAMEYLNSDENIPDHIRAIIESYYATIE